MARNEMSTIKLSNDKPKCRYCSAPIEKEGFCNKDHKQLFMEMVARGDNAYAPIIKGRNLTDKETLLQEDWKKKNKRKAKAQLLSA